jgi:hypothetical protein
VSHFAWKRVMAAPSCVPQKIVGHAHEAEAGSQRAWRATEH